MNSARVLEVPSGEEEDPAVLAAIAAAEALLRFLLRRTPRRELPLSPVEGQPQTMYAPTARVEGGAPDVD